MLQKFFVLSAICFCLPDLFAADYSLNDGTAVSGDIVKLDDNGMMLRTASDVYTNLAWSRFSQESLKQLSASSNPKIRPLVEPFIEPDAPKRFPKSEVKVSPVSRLKNPADPSLVGGFVGSPVGLLILIILYAANIYAGFEIAVVRGRPIAQVMALSAVLPVIAPIIFLSMPVKVQPVADTEQPEAQGQSVAEPPVQEEIVITEASWKEDKKLQPQIFSRGKYTFNKRFIETKFAGFMGDARKGDALQFSMEITAAGRQYAVKKILQIGATDVAVETAETPSVTLALTDISEIKLNPINA